MLWLTKPYSGREFLESVFVLWPDLGNVKIINAHLVQCALSKFDILRLYLFSVNELLVGSRVIPCACES